MNIPTTSPELNLRSLEITDAAAYFEVIDSNREHFSQFGDNTAAKYPDIQAVRDSITEPENPAKRRFGIWAGDELAGVINLTPRGVDAEVGYLLDSRHTGNGYATLALAGITQYALPHYAEVFAVAHPDNSASQRVLERSEFEFAKHLTTHLLLFRYMQPDARQALATGVMKKIASNGDERATNSHTYDGTEAGMSRLLTTFIGKKNNQLQRQLEAAMQHIATHPQTDGSKMIQGFGGMGGEGSPTFNHEHVKLWRFKASEATQKVSKMNDLRDIRIVYALLQSRINPSSAAVGIHSILSRGDFEKKFH